MKSLYLFLIVILSTVPAFGQMSGWSAIKPVLVKENSGNQLINYQLKLTVNTADLVTAGQMLASGDDIRFTSECGGGVNFNYWIESGMNTSATTIWVKIDTIPANGARTIYLQYGNASASAISAINGTFIGPNSATDSVSGGANGGVTNSQRGIRFAANEDVLVTSFGKNEPNGSTRYVTLFDFATQAVLRQEQISGPAGQYSYQSISSPIWLTQGTQYLLEMYQGSSDGYYFGPSTSQIGQHLTYLDMRYCNGCDQNTFPTNYLNSIHYGYPDLWYYAKSNVSPAPTYTFDAFEFNLFDSTYVCMNNGVTMSSDLIGGQIPFTFSWTGTSISDPSVQNPTMSPLINSTYYVSVTDACGIVKSDSVYIEVKNLPVVDINISNALICNGESSELTVAGNFDFLWSTGEINDTIVVSPGSTSLYSVSATDQYLCTGTDAVVVTVNVPLTATHDISICANETYTVGTHTYNSAGTYIDTLAGVTSCDSIVTTNLTINSLPVATHNVTICFGTSYTIGAHTYSIEGTYIDTLSGFTGCDSVITTVLNISEDIDAQAQQINLMLVANIGADGYQWVDCNNNNAPIPGATESYYEVAANGSYAVEVTVGNCTKLSSCFVINTVGLDEQTLIENISAYPNPSDGVFTITSSIGQPLYVIDAVGSVVASLTIEAGESVELDLTRFSTGIYYLKSRAKVLRLIVE